MGTGIRETCISFSLLSSRVPQSKMSASFRAAGMTYLQFSSIAARAVRASLKPEPAAEAAKRTHEIAMTTVRTWENGEAATNPKAVKGSAEEAIQAAKVAKSS
mmetsp:Transcript_298/g.961  ORF Transcript_298/g.961 Transcript_298/m.961 type:complete len:103 (+) Transcript_298:25-333(+)